MTDRTWRYCVFMAAKVGGLLTPIKDGMRQIHAANSNKEAVFFAAQMARDAKQLVKALDQFVWAMEQVANPQEENKIVEIKATKAG